MVQNEVGPFCRRQFIIVAESEMLLTW